MTDLDETRTPVVDMDETETPVVETVRLPFPLRAWTCDPSLAHIPGACGGDGGNGPTGHYGTFGVPEQVAADAARMPIYHDNDNNDRRMFIGVDQGAEHVGGLPVVGARGDTDVRYGTLRDGAGRASVVAYLASATGTEVSRHGAAPVVRLIGPSTQGDWDRVVAAVRLVNAALPPGSRMTVGEPSEGLSLRDTVDRSGAQFVSGREMAGTIHVEFVPEGTFHSDTAAATTWNYPKADGGTDWSYIQFHRGANSYGDRRRETRQGTILLAHELMHALGIDGHVSPSFDTIMEGTADIHDTAQGIRQPMSLLYPVDREALQVLYGRLENGDSPASLGPWSSTSLHVHGNGEHAGFGVALRNGYAEPWAYGYLPGQDLADNPALSGTVTWAGTLLGLTPGAAAVAGDARIGVDLASLTGRADFTGLEAWAPSEAPGAAGTGVTWLDGDLGYAIAVRGNTFRETSGDAGQLTGIFVGRSHEGATGTLERDDLTAAFGAER